MRNKTVNTSAITFDIDWAPDWCIELCAEVIREFDFKATIFATHPCDILDDLLADREHFEVGIHPNFAPQSTQGDSFREVMDYCMNLCPEAHVMRTHSLFQSSQLLQMIEREYHQIEVDVSLFLPFHENLHPVALPTVSRPRGAGLIRVPFNWEDDASAQFDHWSWDTKVEPRDGIHILNFHPIHVALNTRILDQYEALKRNLGSKPLCNLTREEAAPFCNDKSGTYTFLRAALEAFSKNTTKTISQIASDYRLETKPS